MNWHFSYIGLIFLLMLFVPNILWAKKMPKDYDHYSKNENKFLLILERTGQFLVTFFALFAPAGCGSKWWIVWLVVAGLLMVLYEVFWISYFKSERQMNDFYRSMLGIPLPGATLPVVAFALLAIYECHPLLFISVLILGVGHIGIHRGHLKEISERKTVIREIRPEEIPLLNDFRYEAIFIPEGSPVPPMSIIENEDLQVYVRDFGKKPDDRCLVAEVDGKIVGAVWTRIMDDYGHIDNQTPSLAISLYREYRNRGIGTQLMHRMLEKLKADGYKSVSLSVQKANYALQMYRKAGFVPVSDHGDELLMVCRL